MTVRGVRLAVAASVLLWMGIAGAAALGVLPPLIVLGAFAMLFGSLCRLNAIMDAPVYDNRTAGHYARLAIGASIVGIVGIVGIVAAFGL